MKKVIIFSVSLLIGIACNTSVKNTDKAEITATDSTEILNEEIIEDKASPDSLKDYFSEEKSNGKRWIQVKDAVSADQNGFYIYFRKENSNAKGLRMRIQYADHDIYQFSVDGVKYTYKANKYKNSDARFVKGTGLNWYDFEVKRNDLKFLETIVKSENTRIIFSDGTSVPVTEDMKTDIQRTLDYFESLGGQLPRSNMVNIRNL